MKLDSHDCLCYAVSFVKLHNGNFCKKSRSSTFNQMKITFDNRISSSDTLEETGKKILQTILEKGIYEEIELDVIHDDSGQVHKHIISVDATYLDNNES